MWGAARGAMGVARGGDVDLVCRGQWGCRQGWRWIVRVHVHSLLAARLVPAAAWEGLV